MFGVGEDAAIVAQSIAGNRAPRQPIGVVGCSSRYDP
jgi:hypothetical protein